MEFKQIELWIGFAVFVFVMIYFDLFVFHRKARPVDIRESLVWSVIWVAVAFIFNLGIYFISGADKAIEFFSGYVIERSLSVDNLFVFILILDYFKVPSHYHHNVLFWGIIGALIIRGVFIALGVTLINKFHWMIYVFGFFLILTGFKLAFEKDKKIDPEKNPVLKLFRKVFPVSTEYEGGRYFLKRQGKVWATPLFITLLAVAVTDVVFAVDSIPAILAVTKDPFIVYSSNVFAVLGLRALYFALAALMDMFCHLNYGLAVILIFIGAKMVLEDVIHIHMAITLGVVVVILAVCIITSLLECQRKKGSK